ncbi:hypothetical protein SARC_01061 [Sphaeroforma arctica JP610]|uniref:Uncharacterized protein n=1 Tax=Sphaeroforma arctica JP610 TaxID=667725 RepID=A0A0L0GD11_9EUKA|nr:hypothetical protein SARC_01061 [Sphaeroforma arctica JP610]KNC86799.1 hypothetical protein SARC_01061 [Sphaeroforma arctica JP610]|eukprot:XP_014160701.1 hypothetical protein SARC_01061 [Sphaeroforma arctica JP610]
MQANLVIYNSYIDILFKTKQKAKVVMDTLSIMFEDELTPNISTFNTIINNCVEMDNLRYMERVIVVMDENNVQPDTITFNSMLKLAVKYNYDEYLAFALYKVFIKDYGVKPDRYTLSLLLDIQLHNGDVQGAHDTVDLWISLRREVTPLVYMQFLEAERDACKETRDPESVKRALATLTLMEQRVVLHPLDYARIIETTAPSYPKDALLIYEEVLHHFNREYRPNRECLRVLFSKCENAEDRNRVKNLLFYGRDVRKGIDLNSVEPILKCQSCHINHKTMNVRECNICTCVLCLKCTENHMYIREEPRSHTNGHEHHIQTFYCPNCVT